MINIKCSRNMDILSIGVIQVIEKKGKHIYNYTNKYADGKTGEKN